MTTQERKESHRRGASFSRDEVDVVKNALEAGGGWQRDSDTLSVYKKVLEKFRRMAASF